MTNINIEEIDYDANSPTYVEMIIDTVLNVDKKAGEELSDEERKIKARNEVYHDLYKSYFNMYSDEAKKEIKSVTRKFTDLIKSSKKQNAVEDMEYFYRNFLVDFLFAREERDVILSRLHLAMKSYVGSNIVFLKRNDDMVVYSPARK